MNILSLQPPHLNSANRKELIEYFKNTWELYELLFSSIISEEAYQLAPDPLRHPLIFYYGHTAAFYINRLKASGLIDKGINEHFETIFAKGVDPQKKEELTSIPIELPSLKEVKNYRNRVYELVGNLLENITVPNVVKMNDPLWSVYMALEHDRIHFETSSVLIRQLPTELLSKPRDWKYAPDNSGKVNLSINPKLIHIPPAKAKLGKIHTNYYGWDNEYGSKLSDVPSFHTSQTLISNHQFQEFVLDGGYINHKYWSDTGWAWRTQSNAPHPKFWHLVSNETYEYRAMFDRISMPFSWPVEVNFYEAEAYCSWLGPDIRLMTETEYRNLEQNCRANRELFTPKLYNLNMLYGSPTPVNHYISEQSDLICDIVGNVWQWISNDFYPLPGFAPHPYYPDFSSPYFNGDHAMMLGGSWASTGTSALPDYRLWFRKHFFQHAGFRVCTSKLPSSNNKLLF